MVVGVEALIGQVTARYPVDSASHVGVQSGLLLERSQIAVPGNAAVSPGC